MTDYRLAVDIGGTFTDVVLETAGMNGYGLSDCLRITLGTEVQMLRVLSSLQHWVDRR